jgi:ribosomal protein S18 acetylase RimI-like enzyme
MPASDDIQLHIFSDAHSPYFAGAVLLYDRIWGEGRGHEPMMRHATYPGFKGIVALTPDARVAGFIYGTTNLPGQWWYEQVAPVLGPEDTARYLNGTFYVTELGVDPAFRRHGLGARLLSAVLADLPHSGATLSTQCDNLPARSLYEREGWRYLIEAMRFSADGPEFVIMYRPLP